MKIPISQSKDSLLKERSFFSLGLRAALNNGMLSYLV